VPSNVRSADPRENGQEEKEVDLLINNAARKKKMISEQ
jgi:hypothetical protein